MSKIKRYLQAKKRAKLAKLMEPFMRYAFEHNGKVLKDTRVGSTTSIVHPEALDLADNVFIGQYNFIEASNGMTIEEGCQITNYISILTHSSHNAIRYYGKAYRHSKDLKGYVKGSVRLGKYTFVGPHSTIQAGTSIGKGSIVAAYSMVKGEFPDFAIIAGNPAKVVGDTREADEAFLTEHPELREHYDAWAKA